MIGTVERVRSEASGFTLVELLVVVTLLGVLAAIVTTTFVGFTPRPKTTACAEELRIVETAMRAMMARNRIGSVNAQTTPTNDFSASPGGAGAEPLSPNYIPWTTTRGAYTWTSGGVVSAAATGGCT